jgi:hypothetical protein
VTVSRLVAILAALVVGIWLLRICARPRAATGARSTELQACEEIPTRAEFLDVPFPRSAAARLTGEGKLNPKTKGWYGIYSKAMLSTLGSGVRVDLQKGRQLLRVAEEGKRRSSKQSVSVYVAALGKRLHDPKRKPPSGRRISYDEVVIAYKAYHLTTLACELKNKDACSAVADACKSFLTFRERHNKGK